VNNQINVQSQLQTQIENQKKASYRDLLMRQQDLYGQQVDVKTPEPGEIEYFYDFDTIFATPEQAKKYPSPFAKGGQVGDLTDKILLIIGDNQ